MKKIRLGNTVVMRWEIFMGEDENAVPYILDGKDISVYLTSAFGRIKIEDFTTEGNIIRLTWEGKEQKTAGTYQMVLIENENGDDMRTIDVCDAFELVRCSCYEDDNESDIEELDLSSRFDVLKIYPIIPQIGENGNWWVDGEDTGKPAKGADAYQIAVERGYEGSYEDYAILCANIGRAVVSQEVSQILIMKESDYDPEADYGDALIGLTED